MISKKVILTGSFGVGKTSLFNQFIHQKFSDKYLTTIGVKVNKKTVTVNNETVSLLIWDIAGEVSPDKVPNTYFLGASGILYVVDLSRPLTYNDVSSHMEYLKELIPGSIIKLVANKKDLLSESELEEVIKNIELPVDSITSAKTGENVEELFLSLSKEMIE